MAAVGGDIGAEPFCWGWLAGMPFVEAVDDVSVATVVVMEVDGGGCVVVVDVESVASSSFVGRGCASASASGRGCCSCC